MIRSLLSKFFYPILLIILSYIALRSLISVPFYTSHDSFTHTARIAAYYDSMKDGQFPVKWAKNLNGNLGSPIFIYSYPLVYMIGGGLHFVGVKYEDAFRLIIGGGYLLSGLAMYWWLKNRFGKVPGFMGAVIYLWTPYRFLDVYVRGALAENFAYIFLPLILLGIDKVFLAKSRVNWWWLLMTVSSIGMFLGHNVVSAMFLPVAVVWVGLLFWTTKNKKGALFVLLGLVLAFLASSFIYFPDFFERGFIRFDQGISYWPDHFVYLKQFIRSKWDYGFDLPGYVNDAMSFELGLANWLILGLFTITLLIKRKADKFVVFFIILFSFVIFVAIYNPVSKVVWENAPVMKTIIDFPWRWFGFLALIMAYFGSYLIKNTNKLLVFFLVFAILVANRNHLRVNEAVTYGDEAYDHYTGTATATSNEYTPKWHNSSSFPLNSPRVDKLEGDLVITIGKFTADTQEFKVKANSSGVVRINKFYFPQTTIYNNGRQLQKDLDWKIIDQKTEKTRFDDSGTVELKISSPGGEFVLRRTETDIEKNAGYLSILALILIGIIFYVKKKI